MNAFATWAKPIKLPDGHRIFQYYLPGSEDHLRWAIADESGTTPDQTDDGVLWLDTKRPLSIGKNVYDGSEYICVPLVSPSSDKTRTICNAATLLVLATRFNWAVKDDELDLIYSVANRFST